MVEECCDAAYFRSEMTGRDAPLDLVSMLV